MSKLEPSTLDASFAAIGIACLDPNCAQSIKPLIDAVALGGDSFPYIIATFTEDRSGVVRGGGLVLSFSTSHTSSRQPGMLDSDLDQCLSGCPGR